LPVHSHLLLATRAADKLTYTWGDGGHGVLGQGGDFGRTIECTPQSIVALAGRPVQQIACGWANCAVLMGPSLFGRSFFIFLSPHCQQKPEISTRGARVPAVGLATATKKTRTSPDS
jgi:hypothetical protein